MIAIGLALAAVGVITALFDWWYWKLVGCLMLAAGIVIVWVAYPSA